ncbi:unnamed protein product [Meloidogyne enterolobii]|uniref:Uncharacterized protein n=1 Tax=Meloidogyne enterolobii TaxID=390850 RepID=A0ACB1AWL8_MELEN
MSKGIYIFECSFPFPSNSFNFSHNFIYILLSYQPFLFLVYTIFCLLSNSFTFFSGNLRNFKSRDYR